MSHLVETMAYAYKKGSNEAAYQVPWHGLGTPVSNDLSPQEMLKAANLDWTVERYPTFINIRDEKIPTGKDVLVRSSDHKILTHISPGWNECQNSEAFDLFTEWVREGHMEMNSAGSLKEGAVVWALAKCKESFSLFKGKDEVDLFLLFTNPHVYGQSIDIRATPIRVVCNNTLTLALEGRDKVQIKLNHTQKFNAEYVKNVLAQASKQMTDYKEKAELLSDREYTNNDLFDYYNTIFPSQAAEKPLEQKGVKLSRTAQTVYDLLNTQPGAEYGEGTWWSAYNSVTFALDHKIGRSDDTRMYSAWYGLGRQKKDKALELAVEYAEKSKKLLAA